MTVRQDTSKYQIRAVNVAFRVLGALAEAPKQTLSQLAVSLKMTNSLTYRMLVTLEAEGMVFRDQHRRYSLGSRAMYLGYQAQRSLPINELAQPVIDQLVDATSETVHLVLRSGSERVIVAMKESPQAVRVSTPIGTKFPMYYGGTGLCILAFLPPRCRTRYCSRTWCRRPRKRSATPRRSANSPARSRPGATTSR